MNTGLEKISVDAHERFLKLHPEIQEKLDSVNSNEADALGLNTEEYRQLKLNKAIEEEVERINKFCSEAWLKIDGFEFRVILGSDSIDEYLTLLMSRHQQIAEHIGVSWETYSERNNLKETCKAKYYTILGKYYKQNIMHL